MKNIIPFIWSPVKQTFISALRVQILKQSRYPFIYKASVYKKLYISGCKLSFLFLRQEEESTKPDKTSPFEVVLERCSLACALRSAYDDLVSSGLVRLRINRWILLTFCLPQKVHQFHKKGFMIEPETIDR